MTEECRMQNAEYRRSRSSVRICTLHSAFCILFAASAAAQTNSYTPTTPIPLGDTYLSLPRTSRATVRGK
jgi:hypothetical protein